MRVLSKWAVLALGIAFHAVFMLSIFDIYFVSPLVHGMRHFNPQNPDPARRLVLVVGDGLRADKCFGAIMNASTQERTYLAPFLREKVMNEAAWGISHTRMPTESRPGHVALIAGFYEDVSAVTKGWQTNPVDFDSVFNQSGHTWSYGSPDILPMFVHGATPGVVEMEHYDHSFEDFTRSSIELDRFSFEKVDAIFTEASRNKTLDKALRSDKVVLFLHLLGIDTAGHSYRPYSDEYYDNIRYVDENIEWLQRRVASFYGDDETAFVFTADHGMSDFGSHGDGHPHNTRTPLVVWGKGVRGPLPGFVGHDEESLEWELPVERTDVNQADIASLMAYLIGANYPANSVGELPAAYLDAPQNVKARALAENAKSIVEQYLVKELRVMSSQWRYQPYTPFRNHPIGERISEMERLLEEERYEEAILQAEELMTLGLTGLKYLQRYNWLLLRSLVTLGFLGWIAFAFTSFLWLFLASPEAKNVTKRWVTPLFMASFSGLCGLLNFQKSPWHYYLYAFFPTFFWAQVFRNLETLKDGTRKLLGGRTWPSVAQMVGIFGGIVVVEGIVQGYFDREIFSAFLVAVYAPWPFFSDWRVAIKKWPTTALWIVSCASLSFFTMMPVVKKESVQQVVSSGFVMAGLSFFGVVYLARKLKLRGTTMVACGIQLSLILLSSIVTRTSILSLQARKGLPAGSQLVGWMVLGFSVAAPFMHSLSPVHNYQFRMLNIFMVFCPAMVILSISYEGYFYIAFFLCLVSWVELESALRTHFDLKLGDYRLALSYLFMSHIAFFGTGNIASISSFSLDSVYRLIPVFSPFAMGALLIFKLLIPFALQSVALGILNMRLQLPKYALFSMVLCVSDLLSLNFFYLVVDEGSWLDIGTGISHYCICSMLCLFLIMLEYLSSLLISGIEVDERSVERNSPSSKKLQ